MAAQSDDFTGANGTTLQTHNSNWQYSSATFGSDSNFTIQENQLEIDTGGNIFAYRDDSSEQRAKVTIPAFTSDNNLTMGPSIRMTATSKGYDLHFSVTDGTYYTAIESEQDGLFGTNFTLSAATYAIADPHTLEITIEEDVPTAGTDRIHLWVDGVDVKTWDDSSPLTNTSAFDGLHGFTGGFLRTIDDWTSGAAPASSTPKGPLGHPFYGPFRGPIS